MPKLPERTVAIAGPWPGNVIRVSARPPSTGRVADQGAIFHGKAHTVGGQTDPEPGGDQWRVIAASRRSGNQDDRWVCRGNGLSQRRGGRRRHQTGKFLAVRDQDPIGPAASPCPCQIGDPGSDEQPGDVAAAELTRDLSRRGEHFPRDGTRETIGPSLADDEDTPACLHHILRHCRGPRRHSRSNQLLLL